MNDGSRTNRSSAVNASTTDGMMTSQPAPPHPTPSVATATAAAATVPMSTTVARTAPPLPVDTVSGVDTANTVTLGDGAAMVVTTPPRQVGENKGDGRRTQGSSGAVQAGANATAGAAPMVFDEPGDAVEVAAVNNVNSVNNVLMGEFRHASPIPLRMSTPQTPMTGSLEKDQGRTFTVKICREAVFDSVRTVLYTSMYTVRCCRCCGCVGAWTVVGLVQSLVGCCGCVGEKSKGMLWLYSLFRHLHVVW